MSLYTPFRVGALALVLASAAMGQETRASLVGTVSDPSAAPMPGVRVRATHTVTGVTVETRTNSAGLYQLLYLLPGVYTVSAESPGFMTLIRQGIELRINDRVELNLSMEIGDVNQRVEVTGETPLLETATASLGQVIDRRRIQELPILHGNPMAVLDLTPGLAQTRTSNLGIWGFRVSDNAWTTSYAVDGARSNFNEITLDGVSNTTRLGGGGLNNTVAYTPPADIVDEFKVQTASFDASVGQTAGATINMSIKPGTNEVHGTAYWVKIFPELNANQWFANRAGQPRTDFKYNRYGSSITGPVLIPKLYRGRDRTFFSHGFEGYRDLAPWPQTLTVPRPEQLTGDFSGLLRLGAIYQIYDPLTARALPNGRIERDPIPNNIIPANRISNFAKGIAKYWPAPRVEGTADGTNNFPDPNQPDRNFYFSHVVRIDHMITPGNRLFARGAISRNVEKYRDAFLNESTGGNLYRRNRGFMIDDVHSFGPRFVLDVRYGYTRFREDNEPKSLGFDATTLGFNRDLINQIDRQAWSFPCIAVSGAASLGCISTTFESTDNHDFIAAVDAIQGAHSMKFGFNARAYRRNSYNFGQAMPRLDFGVTYTRGPLDNSPTAPIGQGLASFLLGIPTGGAIDRNASYAQQSAGYALYFQDDWRVTRNLTLNLGLRYEYEGPLTERFNRSVRNYDFAAPSPIETAVRANYALNPIPEIPPDQFRLIGGLTFGGVGGNPRGLYQSDKNNFMPRFGLAWKITPKTVLRGGYGIFFSYLGVRSLDVIQTGFSQRTNVIPSLDNGLTFRIPNLGNPFVDGILDPSGASKGLSTYLGLGINVFNPWPVTPYNQRWQLGIQRELPHRVLLDVAYVGNRGTNLQISRSLNPLPNRYLSQSPVRDQPHIDYMTQLFPNPFYPLLPGTGLAATRINRTLFLTPYPQFTSISDIVYDGFSWYHSLQARVERRFATGYTFQLSYTWSKLMEATAFLNAADTYPERVISAQDFPHRLAMSWIYELPFGRGRRFGTTAGRITGAVISGWQVQGVYTFQSGQALGFGNAIFFGDLKNVPLPKSERTVDRWFNTDAGFEKAPARQLTLNYRTFNSRFSGIRGDGINQWNLSVIKNTRIHERLSLQFRAEGINALNHPQFTNPITTPTSTAFGRVTDEKSSGRAMQWGLKLLW